MVDDWHVHFLQKDEDRLGLLKAIDQFRDRQAWEGTEVIPMWLAGKRGLIDDYPEFAHRREGDWVRIVEPAEDQWKTILEWSASGGLTKPIAGPPRNDTYSFRLVTGPFKEAMSRFHLPEHRFYPVDITHEVTGECRRYYLFQLLKSSWEFKKAAYWPAISYSIFNKEKKEVVRHFPAGAARTLDEALAPYRELAQGFDFMKNPYEFLHDCLVFEEPYDLVWGFLSLGLSEEMGSALLAEFGDRWIGNWRRLPHFTAFRKDLDLIPAGMTHGKLV